MAGLSTPLSIVATSVTQGQGYLLTGLLGGLNTIANIWHAVVPAECLSLHSVSAGKKEGSSWPIGTTVPPFCPLTASLHPMNTPTFTMPVSSQAQPHLSTPPYGSTFFLLLPSSTPCLVPAVFFGFKKQHSFRNEPPRFKHQPSQFLADGWRPVTQSLCDSGSSPIKWV